MVTTMFVFAMISSARAARVSMMFENYIKYDEDAICNMVDVYAPHKAQFYRDKYHSSRW